MAHPHTHGVLTAEDFKTIHLSCPQFMFKKDQVLLEKGEHVTSLFQIIDGSVRATLATGQNITLTAPDFFGEVEFLDCAPAKMTVYADSDTVQVCQLPSAVLHNLCVNDPTLPARFYHYLACELAKISRRYAEQPHGSKRSWFGTMFELFQEGRRRLSSLGEDEAPAAAGSAEVQTHSILERDDWFHLLRTAEVVKCTSDTVLLSEGAPVCSLYHIAEGGVRVVKSVDGITTVLAHLGPNEVFGELEFLDGGPAHASVIVETETAVVQLIPTSFTDLMLKKKADMPERFYKFLALELSRRLRAEMEDLDGGRSLLRPFLRLFPERA